MTPGERLRQCVVEVWRADGGFRGSGFFVAPGVVVTCAHVVPGPGAAVTVRWDDRDLPAVVAGVFPDGGPRDGDYHPFPDLAVLRVQEGPADHPCVRFAEDEPAPGLMVLAAGFSAATPTSGVHADSLLLTVAGPADRFLRVTADRVVPGFSGSPAADPRTGEVVGVVKASRDIGGVQGGWLTPTRAVLDVLGAEVVAANGRHHRHRVPLPLPAGLAELLRAEHAEAGAAPDRYPPQRHPLDEFYVDQSFGDLVAGEEVATRDPVGAVRAGGHLLVEGQPGAGKSTLLRHLVRLAAGWWIDAEGNAADPGGAPLGPVVPVLVRAAELVATTLPDALAARPLALPGGRLAPEMFATRPLPEVSWLVLVDGLDEIADDDDRGAVIRRLAGHMADGHHRFVVTTRPLDEFEMSILCAAAGPPQRLRPFDGRTLDLFAQRWFGAHRPETAAAAAAAFLGAVDHAALRRHLGLPLLATIAAHLWCYAGLDRLPRTKALLYGEFVRYLGHARAAATHAHLTERLGYLRVEGRPLAEVLFDQRDTLLATVALAYVRSSTRSLLDVALETVETGAVALPPDWPDAVRTTLLSTGLVVRSSGGDLEFLHRSFAEYLAAGQIAEEVGPSREAVHPYVDGVIYPGVGNDLAEFVVERWGRRPDSQAGEVLVHYILIERHRHAWPAAVNLINAGLPADGLAGLLIGKLAFDAREGYVREALLLCRLADRPEALAAIRELAEDAAVIWRIRVIMTDTLARLAPDAGERSAALDTLRRWAGEQEPWLVYLAALSLTDLDPPVGRQVLRGLVDGDDLWGRVVAAAELARLGEQAEMTEVLRGVAADAGAQPGERLPAIKGLRELGNEEEARALLHVLAAGPVTATPGWVSVARALTPDHDAQLELYRRIAVHGVTGERLTAATELWRNHRADPVAADTMRDLACDPAIPNDDLLPAVRSILGDDEGGRVLRAIADSEEDWRQVVVAGVRLLRIGRFDDGDAVLADLLASPEPAAWFAAVRAWRDNEVRVRRPVQLAAAIVLSTWERREKWASTVHRLAGLEDGVVTSAQALLSEAGFTELAGVLTDLLDTAAADET
jgi:hypothetical protein